ncbi:tetratricopeptide repeat family protein [Coxiella burnetii CbuK_Q154]|nr:tetratricopeptide repeat protein [Coxiella burnetii]ACJ20234.1 tetratricopeptide repeat family protein [Coxiella burnetii CbuK_Q154]AIT63298.1 Tetratricopeptide repeat family protein [Coxiella burnetii str. Namibia]PHH57375.1 hypothetical protein CRH12_05770 [Coxiella burnetii]
MSQTTYIEKQKRLSQSQLWTGQRAFYDQKGAEAWAGDVPFYITSNPFIANCYAKLVIRFIQDWINLHPESRYEPFYVLELGAGSGQFSFFVLKQLNSLQTQLNISHLNIKYVMSDFTENNVSFWQNQKMLLSFLEKKQLDFAIYDLENDQSITLIESGTELRSNSLSNPLIVFANYIFDSIKADVFAIKNKKIKESLVTLKSKQKTSFSNAKINWKKIQIKFTERPIPYDYYSNKIFDDILNQYKDQLKNTQLLFPSGALKCLQNLIQISCGKLLLVSSDKGFNTMEELDELDYPELDFHGSFSLMVNYHAIGEYFKHENGEAFIQTPREGLASVVCAAGFQFETLAETQNFLIDSIEGFSPSDYFNFYEHFSKTATKASFEMLLSFLCFSQWDPLLFYQIHDELMKRLNKADEQMISYLKKNLPLIANNFYYVPGCDDIFFAVGMLYYELDEYQKAIHYYLESEKHFGPSFESTYNMGLCHFYAKRYKSAINYFEKALEFNPRAKTAKNLLTKAKRKK